MLLCSKAELAEEQITILPSTYSKQQTQLQTVIGKLTIPNLASYKAIFHSMEQADKVVEVLI